MSNSQEITVPDIGNFKDVAVIDLLVKPGDHIAADAPLITIESDKLAALKTHRDGLMQQLFPSLEEA